MVRDVFVVGLCWWLTWGPVGSCWFKMVPPWSLTYPLKKLMVVKRSFLLGFVNFSGGKLLNFRGVLPLSATATHQDVIFFLISFHWKCFGSDNLLKNEYSFPSIDVLSSDNVPPRSARRLDQEMVVSPAVSSFFSPVDFLNESGTLLEVKSEPLL